MTLRRSLKAIVPKPLRILIARARAATELRRFETRWASARQSVTARPLSALARVLIVPSDPVTLVGALGDDAMIGAVIGALDARVEIEIVTDGETACGVARASGLVPVAIWADADFAAAFAACLKARLYDAVVLVGADIMDGYYSPTVSAKMIAAADLAARAGARTVVLGFSFNAAPAPALARMYNRAARRVQWNLRDAISLARFQKFCTAQAVCVADFAFALEPGVIGEHTRRWIDERRGAGRTLIGFNLHPMLMRNADAAQIATIVERAAEALAALARSRPVAILLLVHDHRESGDGACLEPLYKALKTTLGEDIGIIADEHSAAVLKAVAGALDGVVSGRMHLAIASLGMGVPALCVTYQDKFEGLFAHFQLPDRLLLPPSVLLEPEQLERALRSFVDELPALRATVDANRASVLASARKNFTFATGGDA